MRSLALHCSANTNFTISENELFLRISMVISLRWQSGFASWTMSALLLDYGCTVLLESPTATLTLRLPVYQI